MARKQSGGRFNKFLEFIGLVDDEDPRENDDLLAEADYGRQSYGRGSTYEPQSSRSNTRRSVGSSRRADTHIPAYTGSTPRRRVGSAYGQDDDLDMRRGGRVSERQGYSARPNPAMSRTSSAANNRYSRASRFTDDASLEPQSGMNMPVPRDSRVPTQQRMVMLSLQRLEDCCDVIDHLIAGNMVLLTLDDLDLKLYQRVVDTLSGSVYALKAKIRKASEKTYLVAPGNVDIDDADYVTRNF